MSYNDKLEQTGRKVASARRKYYGTFDYGSGLSARHSGGSFSFGRRFDDGGDEKSSFKDRMESLKDMIMSDSEGTNWGGVAKVGLGILGDTVSGFEDMSDKYSQYTKGVDRFGKGVYSDISDNDSLLAAINNTSALSGISKSDIRNKSVGQDVMSALSSGINATISSGGNYWVGLGALALDAGKSIAQRLQAKSYADRINNYIREKNIKLNQQAFMASEGVDAHNDWMRIMSYYMNPYDYAFGGPLHSNGGDYNGGLTFIDEGGRHEENPLEGVPSGIGPDGTPNLVEEGEVIWNNEYVFSDRLEIPEELKKKYKLGGKKNKAVTFADAITELTKENGISPNDPVTIATTKEIVNEFMDAQESIRATNQAKAKQELDMAQTEDFLAQLDAIQGTPQGQGMELPAVAGMPNETPVTEGGMNPPGMALGGRKFDGGGWEDFFKMLEAYQGSLGASNASGRYAIDKNAKYWNNRSAVDIQNEANYQAFTKWVKEHKDDPNIQKYFEYLDKGINKSKGAKTLLKYDKNGKVVGLADDWENTFEHRRTDNALGIYHLNPSDIAFLNKKQPADVKVPDVALKDFDYNIPFDLDAYLASPDKKDEVSTTTEKTGTQPEFKYRQTSSRYAPVIGSAMAALYGMLNKPDYSNADSIIEAAGRMGRPINIPVRTIGDYRKKNPFDERYLVNMANQNRASAMRTITNTAGGNRSMDLLGAMALAHNNQVDLGEIMRQAYLANRQDDAQVAEFNRGTNIQNMSAINQRNLSQAQLNTQREQAGLSGLAHGYGLRQTIKDNWDSATMESLNSMLASLGAIGKENEEYNILTSMAEQGYFPYYYGNNGAMKYNPYTGEKIVAKSGGKLNRKKRRF